MVCTKYESVTGGARGNFTADSTPSPMPETYEGVVGGAGRGVKIAPGSELLVTGTGEVWVKKETSGWDKL